MSDHAMDHGTVYLASDGRWYRWPDPTPYADEVNARAGAALPPPPPAPPPHMAVPSAPAWAASPYPPSGPAPTLLPAHVGPAGRAGPIGWANTHRLATAVIAAAVLVGLGSLSRGGDGTPKPLQSGVANAAPEPVELEPGAPETTPSAPPPPPPTTAPPAPRVAVAPVYQAPRATPAAPAPAKVAAVAAPPQRAGCDESYPGVCIPPAPPDLDCPEIRHRRFQVVGDDPHGFDADNDGIGCESG